MSKSIAMCKRDWKCLRYAFEWIL